MRVAAKPIGQLIPVTDCELYLMLGWRLLDEPGCSHIRMLAPGETVPRIPEPFGARQMSQMPIIVAEFERNSREVLRIALDQYRGRNTIDIRIWFRDGAELKPGRKGLTMSVAHLPALAEGISTAMSRATAEGLIEKK